MFIEEDMVDFLDAHLSTDNLKKQSVQAHHEDFAGLFSEGGYEAKLFSALDKNDVATAKKILHEVKNEILKKPVGSVERKQLEATLHTLYKKFKHYIETVSLVNKFEEDLEAVEHPEQNKSQEQTQQELEEIEDGSLDVYLLDLQHAIAVKDLQEAKQSYERAKEEFAKLSTSQKKQYHKKLLSAHEAIQNLLSQNPEPQDSYQGVSDAETSDETAQSSQENLNAQLSDIQDAIQKKDFAAAKGLYQQAKNEFSKLSTSQKKQYHKKLLSLRDEILNSLQPPMVRVEENLKQAMDEGDLHEAMVHYEELRSLIRELPEKERLQHTQRAKNYYSWIMTAWNSWQSGHPALDEKEKRLSGRP